MDILDVTAFRRTWMYIMRFREANQRVLMANGKNIYRKKVEFFAWEKLDYTDRIKKEFKL